MDNNYIVSFIMGVFILISCIFEVGIFKINFICGGLIYRLCVFVSDGLRKVIVIEFVFVEYKRNYMVVIVNI